MHIMPKWRQNHIFFKYGDYMHAHMCVYCHCTGNFTESLKVLLWCMLKNLRKAMPLCYFIRNTIIWLIAMYPKIWLLGFNYQLYYELTVWLVTYLSCSSVLSPMKWNYVALRHNITFFPGFHEDFFWWSA